MYFFFSTTHLTSLDHSACLCLTWFHIILQTASSDNWFQLQPVLMLVFLPFLISTTLWIYSNIVTSPFLYTLILYSFQPNHLFSGTGADKCPSVTALPVGEYAAVALLTFFGLNSIKNAWELPSDTSKNNKESAKLGEFVEAEELVKEKIGRKSS